jgi:hypothetical protein
MNKGGQDKMSSTVENFGLKQNLGDATEDFSMSVNGLKPKKRRSINKKANKSSKGSSKASSQNGSFEKPDIEAEVVTTKRNKNAGPSMIRVSCLSQSSLRKSLRNLPIRLMI